MIDFHTHTFFSDGALAPSELVRRAACKGYQAIGLTDHVDSSNLSHVISNVTRVAYDLNRYQECKVIPGVEITHAPPDQIAELVKMARDLGAVIVIVHGETIVEPVSPGTNRAAIEAEVDILAHPGLISQEEVSLAADKGVRLEITSRGGHSLTNGHVARLAKQFRALLAIDTDSHAPGDLIDRGQAIRVLLGAGLDMEHAENVMRMNHELMLQKLEKL